MIFITGDTHGNLDYKKLNVDNFPIQKKLTKRDYVIVVGDMGVIWDDNDEILMEYYNSKKFTTLFIDGNHENFDKLNNYKIEKWNGGNVHKISDSIIHLMRGQIFEIEGLKFFTFGGANSIDKKYRKEGISWWPEELPNEEEYLSAYKNLEKCDYKVDIVLTHSAPYSMLYKINSRIKGNRLNKELDNIEKKLEIGRASCRERV